VPYGIPKERGGESTGNTRKMEKCVASLMSREGVSKSTAIRRCKGILGFTKGGRK
jgi:hypothetical protein